MPAVAQAVNAVVGRGKLHITSPQITAPTKEELIWGRAGQTEQIINMLYPYHVKSDMLSLFNLTSDRQTLSAARQNVQRTVNDALHLVHEEMLPRLLNSCNYHSPSWPLLQPWLRLAIKEGNEELLSDISVEWSKRLRMINDQFRAEKVFLIDGDNVYLQAFEKQAGDRLFIAPVSGNIYINTHKINPDDKAQLRLIAELLTKAASKGQETPPFEDLLDIQGMFPPVRNIWQPIVNNLKEKKLAQEDLLRFQQMSRHYLQSVPTYNKILDTLLAPEKLAYLATFDPAYRAYLLINSPPLVSLLTLDSYFLLAANARGFAGDEEWLKQYGALRAANITLPAISSTTASTNIEEHIPALAQGPNAKRPPGDDPFMPDDTAAQMTDDDTFNSAGLAFDMKARRVPAAATTTTTQPTKGQPHHGPAFSVALQGQEQNPAYIPRPHIRGAAPVSDSQKGLTPSAQEPRVYVEGHGHVLVVEIPELACLGEKELTVAQELRFIGQALVSPFTANALAQQEIEHIDIRGGDCPSEEDVYWLQDRASVFDAMLDLLMMTVPNLRSVYAFRMIVGPTLLMIADDLEGKEISWSERLNYFLNAALQVLSLFHIEVPTLKGVQRSNLFFKGINKKPSGTPEKPPFGNRFSYIRDNKIYVKVNDEEYPLLTGYDETPMIETAPGQDRIIKFNQQEDHWYVEDHIEQAVVDETRRNQNKFKMTLAELPKDAIIEADENEIFTIKVKDKPDITGVFTKMDFIPAREEKIGDEIVAYTASESLPQQDQRLLIHSNAGWEFERSSAKMDNNLKILLASRDEKGADYSHNIFGAMRKADGVSPDPYGVSWLKKDYKYYRVEKISSQDNEITYKLSDFPGGVVKYKSDYFTLEGGSDILFPVKIELVSEDSSTFNLEADALTYLHSNALSGYANFPNRLGPGVYSMAFKPDKAFIVNTDQFAVTFYADREMHIRRKNIYGNGPDIKFWLDKNTWYRIREEAQPKNFEYESLVSCRVARTPGVGSSCPGANIMIESELSKKLTQEVHDGMASDSVPAREKMVEVRANDIPYLYQDKETKNYYYKYSGGYFNAKIIEAANVDENPTGFPCLKITGRSDFFNAEKNIATIVMYDDGNSIRMVDLSTFIAQKLNISQEEAVIFNKKTLFIDMGDIDILERLANEVQMTDELYVEHPREITTAPEYHLTGRALDEAAQTALYPQVLLKNNRYSIKIYDLDAPVEEYSPFIRDAIKYVKRNVDYLQQSMLPRVMNSLTLTHYNHPITEDYLVEILKKNNANFIKDAELSFFLRLASAQNELAYRKIKLVAMADKNNYHPRDAKEDHQAVFIGDRQYIYINLNLLEPGENAQFTPRDELTGAVLSAVLNASGKAGHIVDIPRNNGIFVNIKDAYRSIPGTIKALPLRDESMSRMREVITRYIEKSPHHYPHLAKLSMLPDDWRKLAYLLQFDPGLRAQLMLNSDELLTLATQDINYLISSTEQEVPMLHPWAKKYGKTRGVLTIDPETSLLTDAMTSRVVDLSALTASDGTETITRELPGNKGIYNNVDGGMLYKWNDKYYPLEFFGPSGILVEIGSPGDIREVYYYDPENGELSPLQKAHTQTNVITWNSELDVYVSTAPASDYSAVLKLDKENDLLRLTGANRITRLPGNVRRIEYPWFNLYHPEGASHDIYIQGQGKFLSKKTTLPDNISILYYTNKGGQLIPYAGDTESLLTSRFSPKEIVHPGGEMENYIIAPMSNKNINHYRMARMYNKNVIQLSTPTINSAILIEAVAKLFPDNEINIHLYMGRVHEGQRLLPAAPGIGSPQLKRGASPYEPAVARWAFDQQVTGGAIQPDRVLQGFMPLKETHVYLHYATSEAEAKSCITHFLQKQPFDIYYGLDVDTPESVNVPTYIKDIRVQVARNMKRAKRSLDTAWLKMNTPSYRESIHRYLAYAFDLKDEAVLELIFNRLKTDVSRVRNFVVETAQQNYENIGIVSTRQTPDPKLPGLYKSTLTDPEHLENIPAAFIIPGDAYRRVYIMGDSYPRMETNRKMFETNEMKLEHILTHEASHLAANTYDITYIATKEMDYTQGGLNVQDAQRGLRQIERLLDSPDIKNTVVWTDFVHSLYSYLGQEVPEDTNQVVNVIKNSPVIKANLIMTNADSFAVFVKHVANLGTDGRYKRSVDEDADDEVRESDYKHLGLLFASAREHHIIDLI